MEFRTREGLNTSSSCRWHERPGRGGKPGAVARVRAKGTEVLLAAGFIELGDLAHASGRNEAALRARPELGGGLVLQITSA